DPSQARYLFGSSRSRREWMAEWTPASPGPIIQTNGPMGKHRNAIFYVLTIGVFSALMYYITIKGQFLEAGRNVQVSESASSQWSEFVDSMSHNLTHPLAILLAQIVTII